LGFTPPRPIKRALEQRPERVARWLKETCPAWVAKARRTGAMIYFGGETVVKENANRVLGDAPKGRRPVLAVPIRWVKFSMIPAISPRGAVTFRIADGSLNAERFIEYLAALMAGASRQIIWVVHDRRLHHARDVTARLAEKRTASHWRFGRHTTRKRIPTPS
jgi:hypothetical protein